jgi:biopolymer transport protein ExbD
MKVRNAGKSDAKVEMQMTPMIDVVFQLLTFFIMSFKVALPEGNFNIKMPLGGSASAIDAPTATLRVVMRGDDQGRMNSLVFEGEQLYTGDTKASYDRLHQRVLQMANNLGGPGTIAEPPEVELDFDYDLKYEYIIRVVTEVSGHRDEKGQVLRLFDRVKFAPPKRQG